MSEYDITFGMIFAVAMIDLMLSAMLIALFDKKP